MSHNFPNQEKKLTVILQKCPKVLTKIFKKIYKRFISKINFLMQNE